MKNKMVYGVVFLFLVVLAGMPGSYAAEEDLITQEGTAGSATNEGPGWEKLLEQPAIVIDDENPSDPSEFEGDSESMPGERAPENMPMDDAPGMAGLGVQ